MHKDVRLRTPLVLTGDDLETALFEQSLDESAVARVLEQMRGTSAERAAEELNRALEIDIFEVLSQGWARAPMVSTAVQSSVLTPEPPALVNLDRHNIISTSFVVLDCRVDQSALPALKLTLEIVADVLSATLAARGGRIELVALGEASVIARLKYKGVVVKEHATSVSGAPRDPFKRRPSAPGPQTSLDIQI